MSMLRKVYNLLKPQERLRAGGLMVLMVIGAVVEVAGIGMILPFIILILDPGVIDRYELARWLYLQSGLDSHEQFAMLSCVLLVIFFIVKNAFLFFLAYLQNSFVANKQISMSQDLFRAYLNKPYDFFFVTNTADLQRNLNESVSVVANNVLLNCLSFFSEALVIGAIFILLLAVDPLSSGTALAFAGASLAIFHLFSTRRVQSYSHTIAMTYANMVKWLNQGIGSIREIKISGREPFFLNRYMENTHGFSKAIAKYQVLQALPRSFFEVMTVSVMVMIVVINIWKGTAGQTLASTLGLFAMASFRLMPAMNRMAVMLANIRFGTVRLQLIYDDLRILSGEPPESPLGSAAAKPFLMKSEIRLRGVRYHYPGSPKEILTGLDLTIPKGRSIGIMGASGSGKSTLADLLLGLLLPTRGSITVDGVDITNHIKGWQRNIGYIPQQIYLLDDTIARNVALGVPDKEMDPDRIWAVLAIAQLKEFVSSQTEKLDARIGERGICLSGGQRQRIGIARALYHDPQVMVLDEATSALDGETEASFMKAIEVLEGEKTLIIVAHRLTTLAHCDAIYRIDGGVARPVEGVTDPRGVLKISCHLQESTQKDPKKGR